MNPSLLLGPAMMSLVVGQQPVLRWEFEQAREVVSIDNMPEAQLRGGRLQGMTAWDSYIYLRLPEEGLETSVYRSLRARIYSSAPADLLDIYYKTAAGYWCLGGALPIRSGWAVYSVDLPSNGWRETDQDAARKWGGPDGRIMTFRLDPGNQANRWVMVDWVELSPEPVATEVVPEPVLPAQVVECSAPAEVVAGERVAVRLRLSVAPGEAREATAYARLEGEGTVLADAEQALKVGDGEEVRVTLQLATLPALGATATLRAGLYESVGPEAAADDVRGEVLISLPTAAHANFPRCEVRELGGGPAVFVDGKALPLLCFCAANSNVELDAERKPRRVEMAEAGVRIYSDWFGSSQDGFLGRTGPGEYDYTQFDLYFARALQAAPEALFLPHVYVTAPAWWQKAYPEELCRYASGRHGPQSFASPRWRREMADDLTRLIRHFRAAPYAERIIGLIVCSGYSAEWQSWGLWQDELGDYSDVAVAAWREWLRAKYGSDAALSTAWRDPNVTLTTAEPPGAAARWQGKHLMLRDPETERRVLDFLRFMNGLTADAILHFARVGKAAGDGRLLIGTYYGYLTQHHFHQPESGHCAIERVLESPDIDFLMSPPLYTERAINEVSGFMSVTDSVHRHGKIWLSEADYRTYLSDPSSGYGRTATREATLDVLWREFAHVLCKRAGVSWYDMAAGWLSGPDIPPEIRRMQRIMAQSLRDRRPYHAEVAVFIDPESFYYAAPSDPLYLYLTLYPVVELLRSGAPFDLYVLSDLWKTDLPDYKLYVFLNAYALNEPARRAIVSRVRKPGVSALWHWAAGYAWPGEERRATAQEMAALVGMDLTEVAETAERRLAPEASARDYAARLAATPEEYNPVLPIGPVFVPSGGDVLARLEPSGQPALMRRRLDGATSYYSVLPHLPPAILRQIYIDAGVHVYLDADDCFYTDGRWISLHPAGVGPRTLHLPERAQYQSVRTDLQGRGGEVAVPSSEHFTELLRVGRP